MLSTKYMCNLKRFNVILLNFTGIWIDVTHLINLYPNLKLYINFCLRISLEKNTLGDLCFGTWINYKRLMLNFKQFHEFFKKPKVVGGKTTFSVIGTFCTTYSICLNICFWQGNFGWKCCAFNHGKCRDPCLLWYRGIFLLIASLLANSFSIYPLTLPLFWGFFNIFYHGEINSYILSAIKRYSSFLKKRFGLSENLFQS